MRDTDAGNRRAPPRLRRRSRGAARALALTLAYVSALSLAALGPESFAKEPAPQYAFAVIGGTLQSSADEALTQRLLDAIGRDPDVSFIVYDGNLKSSKEACRDSLFETRHTLLETSKPALVFIPGQHDWTDCGTAEAGSYDPVERLDLLRQTLFADASSMGQNPIPLARESEVSRFRPYRENVRWLVGDTVFVGLNVPGPNNHFLYAGGRNGEFEDRVIANAFWLDHAAEYAKRRGARAIVVLVQGDFDPERYERPERFAWLRFGHRSKRDGFMEFKRSLVKLAETFRGPVVVIHQDDDRSHTGFMIDQPLRNDKGDLVTNLTRIAFAPRSPQNQWIQVDVDLQKRPPFRVTIRDVPKNLPLPAAPTMPSHNDNATPPMPPSMPAVPDSAPASELPPILPEPSRTPSPD
ncbi:MULTISPECIES: hypothetical protein [Paraburkholderia]|jgi:hypothetical protein|uniref:Calcineurin-like phosphoesterase n=1 Tax=Paraburkholderia hospita TaxID=169430 RepID=A0AAN1J6J6_9BURK|nr:hypothetical protein [Paraburkholderia hospita]AUT67980.1 hypothetical protein C2L64_06240 [Paraburkholderia hospita]SEI04643.1 hypothetical protein SAMN05192544_101791 [Paraburkholderia hospita]